MSLTPEQRERYADSLADGVPEEVVEEFDARLHAYLEAWEKGVTTHVNQVTTRKQ